MKGMVLFMKTRVVMANRVNYLIERKEIQYKEFQNELLKNPNAKYKDRFMGVYIINEIKIWIMSEYDYSIKSLLITILLPEEY